MLEATVTRILQAVFGGGSNPGAKTATTILDKASIAIGATTALVDCATIDLSGGKDALALTVKAKYNAGAAAGIKLHLVTSPTNSASGAHTAANHNTVMTDANAHFVASELIGLTIQNTTDGSSGIVTANAATTVTVAALAGGTNNRWTTGDVYAIAGADYDTDDWYSWTLAFAAGAVLRETKYYDVSPMYVKVLVENLDGGQTVTDVEVISAIGA